MFLSYLFKYFLFSFLPFLIIVWDNFGHSWIHPLSLLITYFFLFSNFLPYHLREVLLLFYSLIYGSCKFQQLWIESYGFSFHNLPSPSFFSFSHSPAPSSFPSFSECNFGIHDFISWLVIGAKLLPYCNISEWVLRSWYIVSYIDSWGVVL